MSQAPTENRNEDRRPSPPQAGGGRVPPQNLDAERSVLGGVLLDNKGLNDILEFLKPDDFYREAHRKVFEAMCTLSAKSEPIDRITVKNALTEQGVFASIGGDDFIDLLDKVVPAASNLTYYAKIVAERATARRLIEAAQAIAAEGYEQAGDIADFLDSAESRIFGITETKAQQGFRPVQDVVKDAFKLVESLYGRQEDITGVATGFADLDKLTSGFQPGDLVILAARPSMGKTAFCLNIAAHVGIRAKFNGKKIGVAIFSLEMPSVQLVMRMLASEARVDSQRLRTGRLVESDWSKLAHAAGQLAEANIHIDDSSVLGALDLRAKCRRLAGRFADSDAPLGLVIIDYLQLMKGNERIDSREQQISEISRGLKGLAKELRLPVIALSQLNRSLEKRPDKRPMMSDLRECVTGDTLVVLADGRRVPIQSLVGETPRVVAMLPDGKLAPARSDKVWRVGKKPVFEIALASGRTLRCTAKHRLYGAAGWKRLEELREGDRLAIARSLPQPKRTLVWPEQHLVLLGHLVGDGSYLKGQPLRYTTASEENSRAVAEAAHSLGCTVHRHAGRGNWHQLVLSGNGNRWHPAGVNLWLRELALFGQRSHEKHLPSDVFRLGNDQIALLLRHLWATDGCLYARERGGSSRVFFATNSRRLALDVAALLLRLGIVSRLRKVQQGTYRPLFTVDVSGAEQQRHFLDRVGAFGPRVAQAEKLAAVLSEKAANTNVDTLPIEVFEEVKAKMAASGVSQRQMAALRGTSYGGAGHFKFAPSRAVLAGYAKLLGDSHLREVASSDLFWDRIESITPAGEEDVYDLTVPGPASWLADGIVSHNSGAIEQDADTICFLYREEVYEKDKEEVKGVAEVIIGKQRSGPIGTANVAFLHEFTRFENLAREYTPSGGE
jgi:replicative DNA helicase